MDKKKLASNFIFDIKIHYEGAAIKLRLVHIIRWLIPLLLLICRMILLFRDSAHH